MTDNNSNIIFPEKGEKYLIDKDLNWTSFNVVKKVKVVLLNRYGIRKLKVGHAGTLDPLATGLVIVCAGKETKNISQYQDAEKEYIATIKLGSTTPSFDLETEVDKEFPYDHIRKNDVRLGLQAFLGEQDQIPPVFSAKSVNGKRAYSYARKGREVELKPSRVEFFALDLIKFDLPIVKLRIVCSKGTYIRAFARDLGIALNSGAHLIALRRTRIGEFQVENSMTIPEFEEMMTKM